MKLPDIILGLISTSLVLGTSDANGVFDWEIGVVWVQDNSTGATTSVYIDDAAMANGYIEPVIP